MRGFSLHPERTTSDISFESSPLISIEASTSLDSETHSEGLAISVPRLVIPFEADAREFVILMMVLLHFGEHDFATPCPPPVSS